MPINPELLPILVCPVCKGDLANDAAADTLTCNVCRLCYRIVDGIPDMLVANAEKF